ncbi:MAG TPA: PAS domain S-box protein [Ureibacillus sp.]|nr:PAS domain S-box protein [Ureibacillus sp.]
MYQTVANKLGHGLFMMQNKKFLWVNQSFTEIFDYPQDEILKMDYMQFVYPEDQTKLQQLASQFQSGKIEHYEIEIRAVKRDGTVIDISLGIRGVQYEGTPASIGSVIDISDRKRMELELKESRNRYQNLVENAPVGIMVHQKGIIIYANSMAARLLAAKSADELIGQPIQRLIHRQYEDVVSKRIDNLQNLGVAANTMYQRLMRLDGTEIDVEACAIPIQLNGMPAIESMFWDVTEKKKEEEIIRFRAYHDTLTDLPNLHKFQLDFEEEFNRDKKFTILYININGLNEIHDFYGRQAGEMVLIKVGGRLSGAMAHKGLVYRMEDNRFSMVLEGEVEDGELQSIVEHINRIVNQPIYTSN